MSIVQLNMLTMTSVRGKGLTVWVCYHGALTTSASLLIREGQNTIFYKRRQHCQDECQYVNNQLLQNATTFQRYYYIFTRQQNTTFQIGE